MAINLSPNDRCPCDSGLRIKNYCLRKDRTLRPRQARTLTRPPATGYAHQRCYAAPLNDCSTKITGEHTLSHSVLRELSPTGIIEVNGLPRKPHEEFVSVSISGFTAKVLCDRHNAALSSLDSIGHRFYKSLKTINSDLRDKTKNPRSRPYLFNGHDLERYILKALCGDGFANKMNTERGQIRDWRPSTQWVRILYGLEPFPVGWGLYLAATPGEPFDLDENILGICPVMKADEELCGARFKALGLEFELLMARPNPFQERYSDNCRYRPNEVSFSDGRATQSIMFGWDVKGQGGSLHIDHMVITKPQTGIPAGDPSMNSG
jgi:hypothetical protein